MKKIVFESVLVFSFCLSVAQGQSDSALMDKFAARYRQAATGPEKMNICIEAIDRGLIRQHSSMRDFDRVFGTDFSQQIPPAGKLQSRILFFTGLPKELTVEWQRSNSAVSPVVTGWYISVTFDSEGLIQDYALSNMHK